MYQIWCQSVEQFDSFPRLEYLTPKTPQVPPPPPPVSRGNLFGIHVHSKIDLQMCAKFGANRSSRLTASQGF